VVGLLRNGTIGCANKTFPFTWQGELSNLCPCFVTLPEQRGAWLCRRKSEISIRAAAVLYVSGSSYRHKTNAKLNNQVCPYTRCSAFSRAGRISIEGVPKTNVSARMLF